MTVQATFAATVVDEWVRAGVTDAVVAPGSRSTPLVAALAAVAADGRLRVHVVVDERSAGFFALGLGLATGRPAVVVTTSGTAAVELHPAVVEAYQARVPLLACTADRPPELHHVGAPQTVEQAGLFGGAVRWAFEPGVPDPAAAPTWRSVAARAVAEALGPPAGPVHLNLAFREPLVGEPGDLPPGRPDGAPWHTVAAAAADPAPPPPAAVVERLTARSAQGVIVAGAGAGDPAAVHALAEALGWPVLADPRSGARIPARTTVAAADALARVPAFAHAHRPDLVLRLGSPWASRALGQWLHDVPAVLVDPDGAWLDPDRRAAVVARCDPARLCRAVADCAPTPTPASTEWLDSWAAAEAAAQAAFDDVLAAHDEATEPGTARALVAALPDGASLVVSSSMPIRDVEWYAAPRTGLRVLANRGANGIDGVASTALGVAAASGAGPTAPTVGLLGDLAFLHDVNALLVRNVPCTLAVVDNDGGGIFSFLPQRRALAPGTFERLFGTPHGLDLAAVARAYGAEVVAVGQADELAPAVARPPTDAGVRVVHVRTDRAANVAVHDELHAAVATATATAAAVRRPGGRSGRAPRARPAT